MRSLVFFFLMLGPTFANDSFYVAPIERPLNDQEPEWPVELIKIHKEEYVRNRNASFCTRPTDMLDTVVLHHSETLPTDTAQDMNSYHLNRGTEADPWYMVAYSYVINSPYAKSSNPVPKVTEGRPLDIVGAHAGTSAFVTMNAEQLAMWNDGKITCGKENTDFKVDPILLSKGKIKANVTTLGVVIVGNYAPFSRANPSGYSKKNPRFPTSDTQDMIARLSCQLQKKYPKIKNIRWHNYYHSTLCPGTIKNYIGQIKTMAKGYGCDFY